MEQPSIFKISIKLIKILVFLTSVYFIFKVFEKNLSSIIDIIINWKVLFFLPASVILYVFLMMSLALAWQFLLSNNDPASCAQIYLKSQVLKYLPGNVFHFAYRHSETKKVGVTHQQLIQASIHESIGLMIASIFIANILFLWSNQIYWIAQWAPISFWPLLSIQILSLILVLKWSKLKPLFTPLACYLVYFLGMGFIASGILVIFNFQPHAFLFITACFAFSWLAGYVIPGAPGGLGVREATFILLTSPQITENEALVLIATIRLISVTAETLIYFIAPTLSRPFLHLAVLSDKIEP